MKKILTFLFLLCYLASNAQDYIKFEKTILGTWKYNIANDTIAIVDTANFYKPFAEREKIMFFTKLKIKKQTAQLSEFSEKVNATWEIKNSNELYLFLDNNKTLKYIITKLNSKSLELRQPDSIVTTLRYHK